MKTLLHLFILVVIFSSCSEPKLKLRAPEAANTEKQVKTDSVKNDSLGKEKKNLAD
jgi:hypothetical protein